MGRIFNYPRIWLWFRIPNTDRAIDSVGVAMAVVSLAVLLAFWGECRSPTKAAAFGVLLCLPAVQLGVERGNTDLLIVALVAAACLSAAKKAAAGALILCAAVLKLYPALVFGMFAESSVRATMRAIGWPVLLFLVYLAATAADTTAALRNTPSSMWMVSYGSCVAPSAWAMICAKNGWGSPPPEFLRMDARFVAALLVVMGVVLGFRGKSRRQRGSAELAPEPLARPLNCREGTEPVVRNPHQMGFSAATWIFAGTFIAGSNFDYRLDFLLLAVPQLLVWSRLPGRQISSAAAVALTSVILSLGSNFLWFGWVGIWAKQAATWTLMLVLPWLLIRLSGASAEPESTIR